MRRHRRSGNSSSRDGRRSSPAMMPMPNALSRQPRVGRGARLQVSACSAVAELPIEDLLARLELGEASVGLEAGHGGGHGPSGRCWSAVKDYAFEGAGELLGARARQDSGQVPRIRFAAGATRVKAIRNLIAIVGDKPIDELTGDDMLEFRDWWWERIETDGLTPNSGSSYRTHAGDVLKTVNRMKRLGLVLPLSDLSFKVGEAGRRPPSRMRGSRTGCLHPGHLTA